MLPPRVTRRISGTQPPPSHHIFPFGSCTISFDVSVPSGIEELSINCDHVAVARLNFHHAANLPFALESTAGRVACINDP
jgi:hypothetical protein